MHRLKDAYKGKCAVVILGGPSLIKQEFDFTLLRDKPFTVFLEAKALTPQLVKSGLVPDYYLMLFPEKSVSNALQTYIFRSFLAQVRVDPFLKRQWRPVAKEMRERFDACFEPWRLHKGPHKRYRWRPGVYLPDSPLDLLRHLPTTRIIAHGSSWDAQMASIPIPNPVYRFEMDSAGSDGSNGDSLRIPPSTSFNSAAIALYDLLGHMGFESVYFLGMDMTILGSMEYAAPYTFRSLWHFRWFFWRTHHVFNAAYKPNRPFYFRPKSEFEDTRQAFSKGQTRWVRVYDPGHFSAPLEEIPTISMKEFIAL